MPPHVQARWVPSNNGQVPPNTVEGGYQDGNKTFVGRAHHDGQLAPGEVSQNSGSRTGKRHGEIYNHSTGFLPAYRNGIGAIPRDKVRLGHGHGVSPGVEPLSPSKQDN